MLAEEYIIGYVTANEQVSLRVLPHSSIPAILSKTRLRMRLWTSVSEATLRMRFTRATRPQ